MKILHIIGARPNFMKLAPIVAEMKQRGTFRQILVHTGQHYDDALSQVFFHELGIPQPDINLEVGSSSHAVQTATIMMKLEPILEEKRPDWVVVVGDVNSTLAATVTASKLGIRVAHVEAGLRSFDRTMPEEINRIVTDALADLLLTTERTGEENLLKEGIPKEKIVFVGNVMIDTLLKFRQQASRSSVVERLGVHPGAYALVTLHRPSSVDHPERLESVLHTLMKVAQMLPIVFPCHPRTRAQIGEMGLEHLFETDQSFKGSGMLLTAPLGYLDFLSLMSKAKCVLTDSGGIQEETTILDIPCLTLRENTERPVTIREGTNLLVGHDEKRIIDEAQKIVNGQGKKGRVPELWDGHAAHRIVEALVSR